MWAIYKASFEHPRRNRRPHIQSTLCRLPGHILFHHVEANFCRGKNDSSSKLKLQKSLLFFFILFDRHYCSLCWQPWALLNRKAPSTLKEAIHQLNPHQEMAPLCRWKELKIHPWTLVSSSRSPTIVLLTTTITHLNSNSFTTNPTIATTATTLGLISSLTTTTAVQATIIIISSSTAVEVATSMEAATINTDHIQTTAITPDTLAGAKAIRMAPKNQHQQMSRHHHQHQLTQMKFSFLNGYLIKLNDDDTKQQEYKGYHVVTFVCFHINHLVSQVMTLWTPFLDPRVVQFGSSWMRRCCWMGSILLNVRQV